MKANHERARLSEVVRHLPYDQDTWDNCWFLDQSMVELGRNGVITWFWRHGGEQWIPDMPTYQKISKHR